ncbi:ketoacyl-ACP synthase III family protein [Amycolatopsis thermoflava]|uniref:ketoacyl-ACP synthase III family protein n=1 Tax=Amycolatopsis thermoflava TaxID=84480 RepID=UPI0003FCB2AD|nr:ketoacyl-ACP synthase III family protein [Amycolatopsis thermoflava]
MRYDHIYFSGIGTFLGEPEPVQSAIGRGEYSLAEARRSQQRAAAVVDEPPDAMPAPLMAVHAGREALRDLATRPDSILYGHVHHQGFEFWNPACYLRDQLGLPAGPGMALTVGAMSNSAVAGLELAADRITSGKDDAILVAAADRFGGARFPRWSTDRGIVYGDGAGAVVLSRQPGFAKLDATASWTDASLEGLHRGHEPFAAHPSGHIEVGLRKQQWLSSNSRAVVQARNSAGVTDVVKRALADAHLDLGDISFVCGPHYGRQLAHDQILQPLGVTEDRSTVQLGLDLGHLGAADQLVAFHYLTVSGAILPGDHVLLVGAGVGMTWTAAIVTVTRW